MDLQPDRTQTSGPLEAPPPRQAAVSAHDRIGPDRILTVIGRGGMGAVYRALHQDSGQVVALKTVLLPGRELLQSLRREIRALARLAHPGIVKIVSEGVEAGLPWYAMELVEGTSLGEHAAELRGQAGRSERPTPPPAGSTATAARGGSQVSGLWSDAIEAHTQLDVWARTGAEPPPADEPPEMRLAAASEPLSEKALCQILGVARRLCLTLAYLHGEGIVHRDLKPGNVMVRAASGEQRAASEQQWNASGLAARGSQLAAPGIPVIVDFGLAADWPFAKLGLAAGADLESREKLETTALSAGTIAYMAPEQKAGELVDARADLYALGAILYELVTGQRLFGAKGLQRTPGQRHLAGEELPEGWEQGLPERLRPLLSALLAQEPQQRMGYASAVAAALLEARS